MIRLRRSATDDHYAFTNWCRMSSFHRWSILLLFCALAPGCATEDGPAATFKSVAEAQTSPDSALKPSAPVTNGFQFTSMVSVTGITFQHESGDGPEKPFPAANGSGAGILDIDLDGLRDVLFVTNNPFGAEVKSRSNKCFRNKRDWHFSDITDVSQLQFAGHCAGVAVGDYNNDGFPDVYVTCFGENQLFENSGDGTFRNVSESSRANNSGWGTSSAFLDADDDGLLDLYVGNYAHWSERENVFCGDHQRQIRMFCSPKTVAPAADTLYRNMGDGSFEDISQSSGIDGPKGRSQGVLTGDFNGDGMTDVYVSNDLNPNFIWMNQGNGRFVEKADELGAAYSSTGSAQAGMGLGCSDANRDGLFDLLVTNFEGEHNAYYEQDRAGYFSEVSHLRGLAAASIPWIGWGTTMTDFDLDGWPDIMVLNGHTDNNMEELGREGEYRQPPLFWRNVRGKFDLVVPTMSPYFQQSHPGRGLAIADLDNDQDRDAVCCHQDSAPELLRNDCSRPIDSIVIQLNLIGDRTNRSAVGAVVECQLDDRMIREQVLGGGSYLSSSDSRVVIVVPGAETRDKESIHVVVRWNSSETDEFDIPLLSGDSIIRGSHLFPVIESSK